MASLNWYNINSHTDYPLTNSAAGSNTVSGVIIPKSALVDAGFILGCATDKPSTSDTKVWLYDVYSGSGLIHFVFANEADLDDFDVPTYVFRFSRSPTDPVGKVEYVDATPYGGGTGDPSHGFAFLATGDLTELWDNLQATPSSSDSSEPLPIVQVEPSLVQSMYGYFVTRFRVANDPGAACHTCGDPAISPPTPGYCVEPTVLTGAVANDVKFQEGYNCRISTNNIASSMTFAAIVGEGEGQPCYEIDRTNPPAEACAYDFPCDSLLYSINGISPDDNGNFKIFVETGFILTVVSGGLVITPDPDSAYNSCPV